jgi:hypothetical protein
VNPSVDAGGVNFDDDDEYFKEDYNNGVFDVKCEYCQGRGLVPAPDTRNMNDRFKVIMSLYNEHLDMESYYEAERRAERMMGA